MVELPLIPDGCRVISLWRNVSGDNWNPVYEIIGYTIVDEIDFDWLNKYRWLMIENYKGDCYVKRYEWCGGKLIHVFMSREILGLPRGAGRGSNRADHIDHDTLNNRRNNLRVTTPSQNQANRRGYGCSMRFKGYDRSRRKYSARITLSGLTTHFTVVLTEVEAALMHNYAAYLVFEENAYLNVVPEDEMPTVERQWKLYDMVVAKLRLNGYPCANALTREECN